MTRRQHNARRTTMPVAVATSAVTAVALTLSPTPSLAEMAVVGSAAGSPAAGSGSRITKIAVPGHPTDLTVVKDTLFFTLSSAEHGFSLWKSDGTARGTRMVKDTSSVPDGGIIYDLTAVGGTLFFTAYDDTHGRELWKSDGTGSGTRMVKDIDPRDWSYPAELTNVGGTLFFTADDAVNGRELWKSDGTSAGTLLVKDVLPGPAASSPAELTAMGGALYFTAGDGTTDRDLWKSDGTTQGTVLLKDIEPNEEYYAIYQPEQLTAARGTLYFVADDDIHGPGLWKSDGTTEGTVLVKDTTPGTDHNGRYDTPHELVPIGNRLYFSAFDKRGEELWVSDGTPLGTHIVKDVGPGPYPGFPGATREHWVGNLAGLADDTVFFVADDSKHGRELWTTDGTARGTVRLTLMPDNRAHPYYYLPSQRAVRDLFAFGGRMYFVADDGEHGDELWSSNGTRRGTGLVRNFGRGDNDGGVADMTRFRGSLFLVAIDRGRPALWKLNR